MVYSHTMCEYDFDGVLLIDSDAHRYTCIHAQYKHGFQQERQREKGKNKVAAN